MDNQGCGQRLSAEEMDEIRQKNIAYQYLCHLEEAKKWIEACIEEELPDVENLEEEFRHGVHLAKLAKFFSPDTVSSRKIFDYNLSRYRNYGLHFRHTDNINYFLKALKSIGLPKIFYPETTDIYDRKNVPKAVFCIHALSLYLFRLGIAPQIQNLYGRVKFSDEVMKAMMEELSKFGCQMPQFGKIGGILASELPVDEAALHAAIIAINDAVQKWPCAISTRSQDLEELKVTLCNPSSHLSNVILDNLSSYSSVLYKAYIKKKAVALNKSREENYIPDAYDELLTQAEIQGLVNHTNLSEAVMMVERAITKRNYKQLWFSLKAEILAIKDVKVDWVGYYLESLSQEMEKKGESSFNHSLDQTLSNCSLSKGAIQRAVKRAHATVKQHKFELAQLERLNKSLASGTSTDTLSALNAMHSHFAEVMDYAAPLYHEEMAAIRADAQEDLTLEEVIGGVRLLTAVGRVNAALNTGDRTHVWSHLSRPETHLKNLDKNYVSDYIVHLLHLKEEKKKESCPLLTYLEVQETIYRVNQLRNEDNQKIAAVTAVNDAVSSGGPAALLKALKHLSLGVWSATEQNCFHFLDLLRELQKAKRQSLQEEEEIEIWLELEDIQSVASRISQHEEEARSVAQFLSALNDAARRGNITDIEHVLRSCTVVNLHIRKDLMKDVSENLVTSFHHMKSTGKNNSWVVHNLQDKTKVFINVETKEFLWQKPKTFATGGDCVDEKSLPSSCLSLVDVRHIVTSTLNEVALNNKIEGCLVGLQAACRGRLVRNRLKIYSQSATVIQAWWRMMHVRRSYVLYCRALRMWEPQIIKIQRAFRAWRQRRRIDSVTERFRENEQKVVVIQRAWRQHKARLNLHALTRCKNPSVAVVRKFVHLLQVSNFDFEEELKLQRVKSDVVKTIRRSHQLESQIEELDVKIGLLVHNRITLQDVIKPVHDKENMNPNRPQTDTGTKKHKLGTKDSEKHKRGTKDSKKVGTMRTKGGLKALTKESRKRLIGYQHLFYLLQTQPRYLASLIFALPIGKTTKFIENVIFSLYNYGANDRDNYLLLKLMKTALEEEIRSKVLRLSDIVSGNPLVVKMIVSFNRKGAGQSSLRDMLGPLVDKVMMDNHLQINTNPVEIYKMWVNQLEMTSGQASGLPYVVNQEEALQYPEVQKRLLKAVSALREASYQFCCHITSSRHHIPYAMQYMAKVMKAALHNRFPHIHEKEILKVVGNLIYYRYINAVIVAPDAFDIVTLSPEKKLTNEQRRNLASIAKILQFAASKKGFGEEASHLTGLNSFIIECHDKFKTFFKECCSVEEPEQVYDVNQYTEATMIIKPTIYITLQEIVQTHELLLDNKDIISPDAGDPLHQLLKDLGDRPSVLKLVGDTQVCNNSTSLLPVGRTDVCLALSSKFDLQEGMEEQKNGKDSNQKLFNKTKQILVDILQCVEGDVIHALPTGPTLHHQEKVYQDIVGTREQHQKKAKKNNTDLNTSNSFVGDTRVSLSEVKTKLSHNLRRLENRGLASRNDNYQSLLNVIAQDIVNQRQHRINRRCELQKLVQTSRKLEEKENFYKEQLNSYTTYLHTCLTNLASRNKNVHQQVLASKSGKNSKNKLTLKYTGARLHERGIILEIEDLPPHQMKNVLFEITPLATSGVFQIQIKFMGVAMELVQLDIQDLLQLQYEGVSVKTMFGKAKVNVNLLLHLLNTKFYSKKK